MSKDREKLKDKLRKHIKEKEGLKGDCGDGTYKPYKCQAGKDTIGWGTTNYDKTKKVFTRAEIEAYLDKDIDSFIDSVKKIIPDFDNIPVDKQIPITSLAYNTGTNNLKNSGFIKEVNTKNWEAAAERMLHWRSYTATSGGSSYKQISAGLLSRRIDEAKQLIGANHPMFDIVPDPMLYSEIKPKREKAIENTIKKALNKNPNLNKEDIRAWAERESNLNEYLKKNKIKSDPGYKNILE